MFYDMKRYERRTKAGMQEGRKAGQASEEGGRGKEGSKGREGKERKGKARKGGKKEGISY